MDRLRFVRSKRALFPWLCGILGLGAVIHGCGESPSIFPCGEGFPCANDGVCIGGECYYDLDAGTDASDAGGGGANAVDACVGPCVPLPLVEWTGPFALAYGAKDDPALPTKCPESLGSTAFFGRADPLWEPAKCDACKCGEAKGTCAGLPETVELRAAQCGQDGSSLPLGSPGAWDGSCSNANALPEGAKCPAGSSTLCAQSVATSPLGAPSEEACEPYADAPQMPNASLPEVRWGTRALACYVPQCPGSDAVCIPTRGPLPSGFQMCISRAGVQECGAPWNADRKVFYELTPKDDALEDTRDCTPCECGPPAGSCFAHLRTFEDQACAKPTYDIPLSSLDGVCLNVSPGLAVGSVEVSAPEYFPGTCAPTGGEAIGTVKPNDARAVTFCCAPPTQ